MKRIYQGKVTKVELFAGKDASGKPSWQPLDDDDWQSALWRHHELFQDAVNYYTVALAAMAEGAVDSDGKSTPMADFSAQVKERWDIAKQIRFSKLKPTNADDLPWIFRKPEAFGYSFRHKGKQRAGLRQSLCQTLGLPDDETSTWDVCAKKILESALKHFPERKDEKGTDVFHQVIAEMFPEKSRGNPQTMSNSDWPWLCWKHATGESPAKSFYRKNHGIHDFLSELFNAGEHELAKLAKKEVADTFLTSIEQTDDETEDSQKMRRQRMDRRKEKMTVLNDFSMRKPSQNSGLA